MARLLKSIGHHVVTARQISSAIAAFEQGVFDLMISDLDLPDGNGRELLQKLQAMRSIRAIALSGYGMKSDLQENLLAGFAKHLVKPINAQQLRDAVARVMSAHIPEARH